MKHSFNPLFGWAPAGICLIFFLLTLALPAYAQKPIFVQADLVVIHKSKRQLELWSQGETLATYRVALGFNPVGNKEFEGDGRTPEGVYTVIRRNEKSKFFKSLQLDYPNASDVAAARARGLSPGGMIMIHGISNHKTAKQLGHPDSDWTEGCIAVTNLEMQNIWNRVPEGTAVLIMP